MPTYKSSNYDANISSKNIGREITNITLREYEKGFQELQKDLMGEADGSPETSNASYVTNTTSSVKVPAKGKVSNVYSAKTNIKSQISSVNAKDIIDDFIKSSKTLYNETVEFIENYFDESDSEDDNSEDDSNVAKIHPYNGADDDDDSDTDSDLSSYGGIHYPPSSAGSVFSGGALTEAEQKEYEEHQKRYYQLERRLSASTNQSARTHYETEMYNLLERMNELKETNSPYKSGLYNDLRERYKYLEKSLDKLHNPSLITQYETEMYAILERMKELDIKRDSKDDDGDGGDGDGGDGDGDGGDGGDGDGGDGDGDGDGGDGGYGGDDGDGDDNGGNDNIDNFDSDDDGDNGDDDKLFDLIYAVADGHIPYNHFKVEIGPYLNTPLLIKVISEVTGYTLKISAITTARKTFEAIKQLKSRRTDKFNSAIKNITNQINGLQITAKSLRNTQYKGVSEAKINTIHDLYEDIKDNVVNIINESLAEGGQSAVVLKREFDKLYNDVLTGTSMWSPAFAGGSLKPEQKDFRDNSEYFVTPSQKPVTNFLYYL